MIAAAVAVLVAGATDPAEVAEIGSAEDILAEDPGPPAPELVAEGWLNSEPLTKADLDGKVVIVDFWTYSCVNCVRTFPFLRAWHERYADDGLVIVGVHSPEFDFERDHDNVAREVEDQDITWPVAFDDNMVIWNEFGNQFWPAKYVFDRDDRLRFFHPGEGAYEETEDVIRALLGVDPDSRRADDGTDDGGSIPELLPCQAPASVDLDCQTGEAYLGSLRGAASFSSPEGLGEGEAVFTIPDPQPHHTVALGGSWLISGEAAISAADGASIVMAYTGSEINLVMAPPANGSVDVVVELDGEAVPAGSLGGDVTTDDQGRTVVNVDEDALYELVVTSGPGQHVLVLRPDAPGLAAYAFTFGS